MTYDLFEEKLLLKLKIGKIICQVEYLFINTRDSLSIVIGREGITRGCLNGWYKHTKKCLNIGMTRRLPRGVILQVRAFNTPVLYVN